MTKFCFLGNFESWLDQLDCCCFIYDTDQAILDQNRCCSCRSLSFNRAFALDCSFRVHDSSNELQKRRRFENHFSFSISNFNFSNFYRKIETILELSKVSASKSHRLYRTLAASPDHVSHNCINCKHIPHRLLFYFNSCLRLSQHVLHIFIRTRTFCIYPFDEHFSKSFKLNFNVSPRLVLILSF